MKYSYMKHYKYFKFSKHYSHYHAFDTQTNVDPWRCSNEWIVIKRQFTFDFEFKVTNNLWSKIARVIKSSNIILIKLTMTI